MTGGKGGYHLVYATANDSRSFALDFLHFRKMARLPPGVENVAITIVVSRVRPISRLHARALEALVKVAEASPWLSVRSVVWKGNIGRDFSSARVGLAEISAVARDTDYVMVRNRSAYGPLAVAWYRRYIDQFNRHPDTGLVGSTINLIGHPASPGTGDSRHVQTYIYLSQWRQLAPLVDDYPGSRCTDRLDVIEQGEIGLSRRIMKRGLGISCLYWPQHVFRMSGVDDPALPRADVKQAARGLPFRYKFPAYVRNPAALLWQGIWNVRLVFAAILAPRGGSSREASAVAYLQVDDFG